VHERGRGDEDVGIPADPLLGFAPRRAGPTTARYWQGYADLRGKNGCRRCDWKGFNDSVVQQALNAAGSLGIARLVGLVLVFLRRRRAGPLLRDLEFLTLLRRFGRPGLRPLLEPVDAAQRFKWLAIPRVRGAAATASLDPSA
jgi:hypothetical protein